MRYGFDSTNLVDETADDRDLVAMINEARDPAEVDRIAAMARHRRRTRRAAVDGAPSPTRRPAFALRRVLNFRHY